MKKEEMSDLHYQCSGVLICLKLLGEFRFNPSVIIEALRNINSTWTKI